LPKPFHLELIDQLVVELAAALVGRKLLNSRGRRIQDIPADDNRTGLLGLVA
jgi:hypothetical protein